MTQTEETPKNTRFWSPDHDRDVRAAAEGAMRQGDGWGPEARRSLRAALRGGPRYSLAAAVTLAAAGMLLLNFALVGTSAAGAVPWLPAVLFALVARSFAATRQAALRRTLALLATLGELGSPELWGAMDVESLVFTTMFRDLHANGFITRSERATGASGTVRVYGLTDLGAAALGPEVAAAWPAVKARRQA